MTPAENGNGNAEQKLSREHRKREYLYRQLADIIQEEIKQGKYTPGDRLPSMDSLAETYSVNKVTVRRALAELRNDGLIYAVPAQGTYVAEPVARPAGRQSPYMTIGLLSTIMVPGQTGFYHMAIIEGIRQALETHHGNLVILPAKHVNPPNKVIDLLLQSNLDAVVLVGHFEDALLRRILTNGPPAALVDHIYRGTPIDTILIDNRGGGYQAMDHLLSLGHRNLGIIAGPPDQVVTKDRLQGAFEALEQYDMSPDDIRVLHGDFERESGYDLIAELANDNPDERPTGLFIMNDEMAAGALQAIHAFTSLKVPQEISLVGFDDTSLALATQPPLTTIRVEKALMGRLAVEHVIDQINNPGHTPTTVVVPTSLIGRETTAAPPAERVPVEAS